VERELTVENCTNYRYLAYSAADNRQLPGSDDLELIDAEIARAYEALQIVTDRTEQVAEATARNEQTDADAVNLAPAAVEVTQKKQKKPTAKAKRIDPRRLTRTQLLQQAKRSGGHTHLKDQEEAQKLMELQHRGEGPRARDPAGDELTSPQWIQRFGFDKGLTPFQVGVRHNACAHARKPTHRLFQLQRAVLLSPEVSQQSLSPSFCHSPLTTTSLSLTHCMGFYPHIRFVGVSVSGVHVLKAWSLHGAEVQEHGDNRVGRWHHPQYSYRCFPDRRLS
jgi:hypothetical protein